MGKGKNTILMVILYMKKNILMEKLKITITITITRITIIMNIFQIIIVTT